MLRILEIVLVFSVVYQSLSVLHVNAFPNPTENDKSVQESRLLQTRSKFATNSTSNKLIYDEAKKLTKQSQTDEQITTKVKDTKVKTKNVEPKQQYSSDYGQGTRVHKKGKKKFRKALMKLLLLGTILKAKFELFLKVVGTVLQFKFFAVALAGLLINIARFYMDLRRGQQPQKVIYYEHANHQHHYEDHEDGWGHGGYWKRSIDEFPAQQQALKDK